MTASRKILRNKAPRPRPMPRARPTRNSTCWKGGPIDTMLADWP